MTGGPFKYTSYMATARLFGRNQLEGNKISNFSTCTTQAGRVLLDPKRVANVAIIVSF
jgi:hypothetical protein